MEKSKHNVRTMIVAFGMLLMFAIVAITGTITYSRYTDSETATMQATAAKWGFVLTVDATNLSGGDSVAYAEEDNNGLSVVANRSMIIPGSSGSMTITINGTAEVASKFVFSLADGYEDIFLSGEANAYYPIEWSVQSDMIRDLTDNGQDTAKWAWTSKSNLALMGEELYQATQLGAVAFPAGAVVNDLTFTFGWEWPYEREAGNSDYALKFNNLDSILSRLTLGSSLDSLLEEYGFIGRYAEYSTQMAFEFLLRVEQTQ